MSRNILITLAVACDNITCGACRNLVDKRCKVFGGQPRMLKKSYSEIPERLPQCLEAENFAKGDWELRMRAALVAPAPTVTPDAPRGATWPVYRCKHVKPGDGGIVDGCGWQGGQVARCPGCGSHRFHRLMNTPQQASERKAEG